MRSGRVVGRGPGRLTTKVENVRDEGEGLREEERKGERFEDE